MADRYNRILSLEPNLFMDGSPILIRAGAMLLDSNTGKLLLQLKFVNVCIERIQAVFVDVRCFNVANESVEGALNFQYLDLSIDRNTSFGEKTPIVLSDNTARSVEITVQRVIFANGEIWVNDISEPFKPLPPLANIHTLGTELVEQLKIEINKNGLINPEYQNIPIELEGHWFCACGALNKDVERECSDCKLPKNLIFEFTQADVLQSLLDRYNDEKALEKAIKDEKDRAEKINVDKEKNADCKKLIKRLVITVPIVLVILISSVIVGQHIKDGKYNRKYTSAEQYEANGDITKAMKQYMEIYEYKDSLDKYYLLSNIGTIACSNFVVGVKSDGTVLSTSSDYGYDMYNGRDVVSTFNNIRSVAFDINHTYALTNNGNILLTKNIYGGADDIIGDPHSKKCDCDYSKWDNISSIVSDIGVAALRNDGTVLYNNFDRYNWDSVNSWRDIVYIDTFWGCIVGVDCHGKVVAAGDLTFGNLNIRDVSEWTDIITVALGECHTVGLKSDGTVVASGVNTKGQCDVSKWTDIVAISAGNYHTIGLKSDGTVVVAGENTYGACNVSSWENVIAVYGSYYNTIGITKDGGILYAGENGTDKLGYKMMSAFKCKKWNLSD